MNTTDTHLRYSLLMIDSCKNDVHASFDSLFQARMSYLVPRKLSDVRTISEFYIGNL